MGHPDKTDVSHRQFTSDWAPEGGFYETRAQQGEDPWADNAQFDPPVPAVDDLAAQRTSAEVRWADLTAPADQTVAPSETYGC